MKKTFLVKRNALFSFTKMSWGALALTSVIGILCVRLIAPNFFWYVFTPIFHSADVFSEKSHALFSSFNNTATLTIQNEKLADENKALINEKQALLQKVAGLSALLDTSIPSKNIPMGILTSVIARPPTSPYDVLLLSKGSEEGVTLGMGAFGAGGVPLGIVSTVFDNFSRITLFSAPGVRVNGWVGHTNVPLTIFGAGAGALQASIARSANVTVGDRVFAPGPDMLVIGTIIRIDDDPSLPNVILRIQPTLNLFSTTWVLLRDVGASVQSAFSFATSSLP